MLFVIIPLILLVLVVATVAAIVRGARQRETHLGDRAPGGVRRFFTYLLLLGTLYLAAFGAADLIGHLVRAGELIVTAGVEGLARSLSFVVVGGAAYALAWRHTSRRLRAEVAERRSLGWGLYLVVALSTALVFVMRAAYNLVGTMLSVESLDDSALVLGGVWAGVLVSHWIVYRSPEVAPERLPNLTIWFGSLAGLATLGWGAAGALGESFHLAYMEVLENGRLVVGAAALIRENLALMVAGAITWWWYWLLHGARRGDQPSWAVYVVAVGVLGGLLTALSSAAAIVSTILEWWLGEGGLTASRHFARLGDPAASLFVGAAVWWYHRWTLAGVRPAQMGEPGRVYRYVAAAIGLVSATAGLATLVAAAVEALIPADVGTPATETLSIALATILVGGIAWGVFWGGAQRAVTQQPSVESRSPSRRIYLNALFGLTAIAALGALLHILAEVFERFLEGSWQVEFLVDVRYSLGVVLASAAVIAYHRRVLADSRRQAVPKAERLPRHIVLVSAHGSDLAEQLRLRLGARVEVWERLDPEAGDLDVEAAVAAVQATEQARVLLITEGSNPPLVVPLR